MTDRQATLLRGKLADAGPIYPMPSGLCERRLETADAARLGRLVVAAYRGTVDDQGEAEQWHASEAQATVAGRLGSVVWPASVAAIERDELAGVCVVTNEAINSCSPSR